MGGRADQRAPYDTVANLIWFAAGNWSELDGLLLLRGIDLWDMPASRALSVLWAVAMENRDEKERSKLAYQLTRPTPRRARRKRDDFWDGADQDGAAFLAAQRGMGDMFG